MKIDRRIIAGTALGVLMATGQASAVPVGAIRLAAPSMPAGTEAPIVLAQASIEELRQKLQDPNLSAEEKKALQAQIDALEAQQAPAKEEAPKEEAPKAEQPAEEPKAEEQAAPSSEEKAPAAEEKPAETEKPAATEEPAATETQKEEPAATEEKTPATDEKAPATDEKAPAATEEKAPSTEEQKAPAADETAPKVEEKATAPAEQPAAREAPKASGEATTSGEAPATTEEKAPAATEKPATTEAPAATETPAAPESSAPSGEQPATGEKSGEAAPAGSDTGTQQTDQSNVLPENAAPVLDSQKEAAPAESKDGTKDAGTATPQAEQTPAAAAAPAPETDQQAQKLEQPVEVKSLTAVEGTRREAPKEPAQMQAREGADVLKQIGDRFVIQFNNQVIVESSDQPRLRRNARDVEYYDLPGGWTREVIIRENGAKVITIRDRYGDVIRRSRIAPDGREYVLVYASGRDRDGQARWRDPGEDLPPLRLSIPVNQYILDAGRVENPDRYYSFLEEPPVEPVRRLYSIDEVKYSARVRDVMRRVDLDVINFEFGSASISESEVQKLRGVAEAIQRIIERNPAETFLIEGHTDAVGSDQANLVLSDRRAEAVAAALSNVFDIPPENLVTQGYGERYLKVKTQEPDRDNRRVAIRRITPLVSPVASAK